MTIFNSEQMSLLLKMLYKLYTTTESEPIKRVAKSLYDLLNRDRDANA